MRVLIDLTDIEQWAGTHGGTQRVVYGISKYFYLNDAQADFELGFVSFSDDAKRFYFTSFEPIYERVEKSHQGDSILSEDISPSLKHRVRMGIRTRVPEAIRSNPAARKTFKKSVRLAKQSLAKANLLVLKKDIDLPFVEFRRDDVILVLGKPWDNLDIQRTLSKEKQAVGFKLVQVVYDLIICLYPHLHHPTLFEPYSQHMFEAIGSSDVMLPISKSSDADLARLCKILVLPMPKTKVIRLGDDIIDKSIPTKNEKPDIRIADEFLLCVGTLEIRKNHNLLYYTYKLAQAQGIELPQLVIVGGKGWLSGDTQYLINNDPALKNKIVILTGIKDEALAWLYTKCKFTVYPSMYEGWGLPIAESLANGKVCVASSTSSMQEIAGDMIDYFSPYSAQDCLDKITALLEPAKLKAKESRIKESYGPFTWQMTYKQVLAAIKNK